MCNALHFRNSDCISELEILFPSFVPFFLLMPGIMAEKNWVSVIFKIISGTEAKERITCKAVAWYSKKSFGKVKGIAEDCTGLWEEQESVTLVGNPELRWTMKEAVQAEWIKIYTCAKSNLMTHNTA